MLSQRPTTMALVDYVEGHKSDEYRIARARSEHKTGAKRHLHFLFREGKVDRMLRASNPGQVLDDMTELLGFIKSTLPYYIDLEKEELQLLSGDNTGENLHGLNPASYQFQHCTVATRSARLDPVGRHRHSDFPDQFGAKKLTRLS